MEANERRPQAFEMRSRAPQAREIPGLRFGADRIRVRVRSTDDTCDTMCGYLEDFQPHILNKMEPRPIV